MSIPSITMDPSAASIILKNARVSEDLPAPVLPHMPIFNGPEMESIKLFRV